MMRHLDLNLLSPEMQRSLYGRVVSSLVERVMIAIVALTLLTTVFVIAIEIQLSYNVSAIQSRQLLSTEYVSVNQDIRSLNSAIGAIEEAQREFVPASVLLEDVMRRTPEGVLIGSMTFDARTMAFRLTGHADLRRNLLDFEAALLDSPFFETVESPISNLFQPRDIAFQFNAVVDVEALKETVEPATE